MGKILVIDGDSETPFEKTPFTQEAKLQDYLEKYPTLIPLGDVVEGASDLLCIGREIGAGPGSIDLLCIDKDAQLTIIETKLRKNTEARREVVGQIIEYASYVCQWTVDHVYQIATEYHAKSGAVSADPKGATLPELIQRLDADAFSDDDFRSTLGQNLKDGKLRLVIAVDELVEPLRATVTFLNSFSSFEILLLQVSSFEESGTKKVLIPSLFGYKPPPTRSDGTRVQSTKENFFEDVETRFAGRERVVAAMIGLHEFSDNNAAFLAWGTGAGRRSFIFHGVRRGLSMFTLYSDGGIDSNVGWTKAWRDLDRDALVDFWVDELNRRLGLNIPKGKEWWKIGHVEDLVRSNKLEEFKQAVHTLCEQVKASSANG